MMEDTMAEAIEDYLEPTEYIDSRSEAVEELVDELIDRMAPKPDVAVKLFKFVRDTDKAFVLLEDNPFYISQLFHVIEHAH